MRVLRDEVPKIDVTISSQSLSRDLGDALMRGKPRRRVSQGRAESPDLVYRVVTKEPHVVILPSDRRLASRGVIDPRELAGERLLSASAAPPLRTIVDDYLTCYRRKASIEGLTVGGGGNLLQRRRRETCPSASVISAKTESKTEDSRGHQRRSEPAARSRRDTGHATSAFLGGSSDWTGAQLCPRSTAPHRRPLRMHGENSPRMTECR